MAAECCPDDEALDATSGIDARRHYKQPDWWTPNAYLPERLRPVNGGGKPRAPSANDPHPQRKFLPHDLLGDRLQLQIRRAFVDLTDLGVAVELLDRILLDEAVAAEEVDSKRRDALGDLR